MDRQALSFEMGSRLKSLREENQLSYQELADALLEKYGIKISKDSLRDYEICSDYRSKAKSLPNLGMRTEYLIILSDFYEVSTDYLLCKTDVRSRDIQVREICKYTGLSEKAVQLISNLQKADHFSTSPIVVALSDIIEDTSCVDLLSNIAIFRADRNIAKQSLDAIESMSYLAQTPPNGFIELKDDIYSRISELQKEDRYMRFDTIDVFTHIIDKLFPPVDWVHYYGICGGYNPNDLLEYMSECKSGATIKGELPEDDLPQ